MVPPAVAADRPRGDDVPLPGTRALTELDGERGEDNDLSEVVDGLDRVRAWAVDHCPRKQRIVGLWRQRALARPRRAADAFMSERASRCPWVVVLHRAEFEHYSAGC